MYLYSSKLSELILLAKKATLLNHFRYKLIVDSSARKEECPYAQICLREAQGEKQELISLISELENLVKELREGLDGL